MTDGAECRKDASCSEVECRARKAKGRAQQPAAGVCASSVWSPMQRLQQQRSHRAGRWCTGVRREPCDVRAADERETGASRAVLSRGVRPCGATRPELQWATPMTRVSVGGANGPRGARWAGARAERERACERRRAREPRSGGEREAAEREMVVRRAKSGERATLQRSNAASRRACAPGQAQQQQQQSSARGARARLAQARQRHGPHRAARATPRRPNARVRLQAQAQAGSSLLARPRCRRRASPRRPDEPEIAPSPLAAAPKRLASVE